jgi:hypothetical protein
MTISFDVLVAASTTDQDYRNLYDISHYVSSRYIMSTPAVRTPQTIAWMAVTAAPHA